jgi:hypothetical protein
MLVEADAGIHARLVKDNCSVANITNNYQIGRRLVIFGSFFECTPNGRIVVVYESHLIQYSIIICTSSF